MLQEAGKLVCVCVYYFCAAGLETFVFGPCGQSEYVGYGLPDWGHSVLPVSGVSLGNELQLSSLEPHPTSTTAFGCAMHPLSDCLPGWSCLVVSRLKWASSCPSHGGQARLRGSVLSSGGLELEISPVGGSCIGIVEAGGGPLALGRAMGEGSESVSSLTSVVMGRTLAAGVMGSSGVVGSGGVGSTVAVSPRPGMDNRWCRDFSNTLTFG